MESSDPANKYVKQILNDNILAKEFDLDKRKFSRNYEGSFFIDSLNTGAKVCYKTKRAFAGENQQFGVPTKSDSYQPVQPQKKARGLKFRI